MQHILDIFHTNLRQTKLAFVQKKLPVIRSLSGAFSTSGLGAKETAWKCCQHFVPRKKSDFEKKQSVGKLSQLKPTLVRCVVLLVFQYVVFQKP
jgi:uncharacterized protein YqhQ